MTMHLSLITDDEGHYLDNLTSRFYRFLRENHEKIYTLKDLTVTHFEQHGVMNVSTRRSEINAQLNPAAEWLRHWKGRSNPADPKSKIVNFYQFVFTGGHAPADSDTRCAEILEGRGEPIRQWGQRTRCDAGHIVRSKPRSHSIGPLPTPALVYSPADHGQLFDDRPNRR